MEREAVELPVFGTDAVGRVEVVVGVDVGSDVSVAVGVAVGVRYTTSNLGCSDVSVDSLE